MRLERWTARRATGALIATLTSVLLWLGPADAGHVPFLGTTSWLPIGPAPISTPGVAKGFSAGRVEAAAPHPADSNVMYIGTDNGGIWKTPIWNRTSADGGPIWFHLTDDQPSLDVSGYHPLIVRAGESGRDTILAAVSMAGAGILKSTSGGLGWQLLGNAQLEGASIGSIAAQPGNLNVLYISIWNGGPGGGVHKSINGGATWQNMTSFHQGGASDVIMDPFDPQVLYAGLVADPSTAGLYKTVDGGVNWKLMTGTSSAFFLGRAVRLEAARSTPGTLYATVFEVDLDSEVSINHYRTTNAKDWTKLPAPGGNQEERSWHVMLAVDPLDAQHVFVNRAYHIFESTDGGQTWSSFESIGDDWVNMAFDAANRPVATADRDLYGFDTATNALDPREGNLQITEFWDITVDPQDPERVYGVSQDHFHAMKFSGSIQWDYMPDGGGETGKVLVHPADSDHLYVSNPLKPSQLVRRSTDGGQHWTTILATSDFEDEDYSLAYTTQKSFAMDPTNPARLLLGTIKVLETTDADSGSPTWTDFSPILSTSSDVSQQYISALAISANGQSVYAATSDGHVWVKHPNKFWEQRDDGLFGQGAGRVVDLRIDPGNPQQAYAVTSGPGGKNIWFLARANKLDTWTNISGDFLGNLGTAAIFVEWQYAPPALYVGTSRNVYHSVNHGQNWTTFGALLPNTLVSDLQHQASHGILAAGTYGRGVWEILVASSTISGQVYWDHNANGVKNANDGGLAGVKVYLDVNGNATHDAFERSAFTDASGKFVLSNVAPGTYTLRQIPPAGFVQTTATWSNLTVNGSTLTGKDFGDYSGRLHYQIAPAQASRNYSPDAFGPGEPRIHPGPPPGSGPPRRIGADEPYIFWGDLNDLPGRLPGQSIGAIDEFDRRPPGEEPR